MTGFKSLVAAGASIVGVLALAGCTPKAGPAPANAPGMAPANPKDLAYCNQLASLYERYGSAQDQRGEDFDVSIAEAINQCHSGDTAGGIATLEKRLKDQDISLPRR